jgi:hypothetical protein
MFNEEEVLSRISDAPWASYKTNMTVGGAGGLGSWVALFLSRVGHGLNVYDFDSVGIENIGGGQFYAGSQAGQLKTEALRKNIWEFSGHSHFTAFPKFIKGSAIDPICIATFDNMEARKDMFEDWLDSAKSKSKDDDRIYAFINISMLPEGGFIEVVDRPSRAKDWIKEWVPSSEIPDLACSFKSTTHNAALMAANAVGILNNIIFNHIHGEELRSIPYKTIIDLNLIMMETYGS